MKVKRWHSTRQISRGLHAVSHPCFLLQYKRFYSPTPAAFRPSHQPTRLTALVPTLQSKACVGEKDVPLCVRSQDVDEDCLTLFMMSNENQFHYMGTEIDTFCVDPDDTVSWPLTRNRHQ